MGRLARKEGSIKVITLLLVLLLVACSPVISTTSLFHSVVKRDALGTVTGLFGKFVTTEEEEEQQEQELKKKSRAEIMEDLRKALER